MMLWVLLAITVLFFVLLRMREHVCVLCTAISLTWGTLLVLYWSGVRIDPVLLGILMGQTVLGVYYLIKKKYPLFQLPALLTLTFVAYVAIVGYDGHGPMLFLVVLWMLFFLFTNNTFVNVAKHIAECCKRW